MTTAAFTAQCSVILYTDVTWMEIMSFLTHFKQSVVHLHVAIIANRSKALHNVTVDALVSTHQPQCNQDSHLGQCEGHQKMKYKCGLTAEMLFAKGYKQHTMTGCILICKAHSYCIFCYYKQCLIYKMENTSK